MVMVLGTFICSITGNAFLMVFFTFALADVSARSFASRFTVPVPILATGVGVGSAVALSGSGVSTAVSS